MWVHLLLSFLDLDLDLLVFLDRLVFDRVRRLPPTVGFKLLIKLSTLFLFLEGLSLIKPSIINLLLRVIQLFTTSLNVCTMFNSSFLVNSSIPTYWPHFFPPVPLSPENDDSMADKNHRFPAKRRASNRRVRNSIYKQSGRCVRSFI